MSNGFISTFDYKVIYVFRINDEAHRGYLKVGDATLHTSSKFDTLSPNSRELNLAAKDRINSYTSTAGVVYELLYTEVAVFNRKYPNGETRLKAFRDHDVHKVLVRSGIKNHFFNTELRQNEWFKTDLETVKRAISAVKNNHASLTVDEISYGLSPIEFRAEQEDAITRTIKQFKVGDRMLWNAKMRFGKTLSALEVAKRAKFKKTLIFTHRPVVSDGWYEDFKKIFYDTDYKFGSKTYGESIEKLVENEKTNFVYFASMQDLRGSSAVGGKFDKNEFIFLIDWDFVVVDEAHEGTQTTLGQRVIEAILDSSTKVPKMLELSGTPFNLLGNFGDSEIFTWDYIMEQRAKRDWPLTHFGDYNPYEELPMLQIYTYDLDRLIPNYFDLEDSAFNFKEFFRTWTGDVAKDYKAMPIDAHIGDFVHKDDVLSFLNLMTKAQADSNYPFATEEFRSYFRHTLWMVPGVKEAKALSKLLQSHPVFSQFNVVNVAGDGDEEVPYNNALTAVRQAIGTNPDDNYSITISCGRLTTGVTVPEWTAVFMLAGSFSTSAANYLQTIFRVQTPANINGKIKENCCVFDFAPDRTLKMVAEAGQLSSKAGNTSNDRNIMGEFLNFCPVVSIDGTNMRPYNVDGLLQQLKKAYTDRVVKNGFDDKHIYNDYLLKLDDLELKDFEELKKIVGASKQAKKVDEININDQGFTDEEYAIIERAEKKPKRELTDAEKALLEERKKKRENAQKAMSILRGISIRIPLLVYGADVPFDQEINIDNFVELIDDSSWNEFMPKDVTKTLFKKFSKYYDVDIFVAAGRQIRNMAKSADELPPTDRVKKIANLFSMFKNPDKETVLTPWRVVNMHMGDCLGGFNFFNEDYSDTIDEPRYLEQGEVTKDVFSKISNILEINSKTGLYPLYVAYSIFRSRCDGIDRKTLTLDKLYEIWKQTVEDNVYVICKTPMARQITKRTLLGYRNGRVNAHAFDDLINQLKEKPQQFKDKILRGRFWNKGDKRMKFNAIVGNPPYQAILGGASPLPVYHLFVQSAKSINPNYFSMIMPSRWFNAGTGLDEFRSDMLNDKRIEILHDFLDARSCFTNVEIKGGIIYFLWNSVYQGKCHTSTHSDSGEIVYSDRYLLEPGIDIFVRNNRMISIIQKVKKLPFVSFSSIVSSRDPFGYDIRLENSFKVAKHKFELEKTVNHSVSFYYNGWRKAGVGYVSLDSVNTNKDWIDKYKVLIPKAWGTGNDSKDWLHPFIVSPHSVCTETYLVVGPFDTLEEAKNVESYIKTKFFHAMVSVLKISQNAAQGVYGYVPLLDYSESWNDEKLYKKYGLDESEISFIESMIKPME